MDQARGVERSILTEPDEQLRSLPVDGLDPDPIRRDARPTVGSEPIDGGVDRAVAVRHFVERRGQRRLARGGGHFPIDRQALIRLRDVPFVDPEIDTQVHTGKPLFGNLLTLQLAHGLFQQLHVHIESDRLDMSSLLRSKEVASAPDLQIERRDPEAASQLAELADRGETLPRRRRQRILGRHQEVRVRTAVGSTHPAAQLV